MSPAPLQGRVVAIIGTGNAYHRGVAIACVESGASVALATVQKDQEFVVASIANEVWAIGAEQLVRAIDATDPAAVAAFAAEVFDRFGRCDALIAAHDRVTDVDADELGPDEFDAAVAVNLTGPFLAAQAFGRLMERAGSGVIVFVDAGARGDAAYRAAKSALAGLAAHLDAEWSVRGVQVQVAAGASSEPEALCSGLVAAVRVFHPGENARNQSSH